MKVLFYSFLFVIGMGTPMLGQDLSFNDPIPFLPRASTEKAVSVCHYQEGFFVAWIDSLHKIHIAYLGKAYDKSTVPEEHVLENVRTPYAPLLKVVGTHLYLLWIDEESLVHYCLNQSSSEWSESKTLHSQKDLTLGEGIAATSFRGQLVIAGRRVNTQELVYGLFSPQADGSLSEGKLSSIPKSKGDAYPSIVAMSDSVLRFSFKGHKEEKIYYLDYFPSNNVWSDKVSFGKSTTSPAVYQVLGSRYLCYIWKGAKKDRKIYYSTSTLFSPPNETVELSEDYTTELPVSICPVDDKKFIMAYVGNDKRLYLSYFTNYDPANWMGDVLFPEKENRTLKDIVIPGAHDSGMSVLSGVGGAEKGTINECNTLTQVQNIEGQLKAGIRMFDLRVGMFKEEFYAKHTPSDCMGESLGGGYGERLEDMVIAMRKFLRDHEKEIILISLSHFCEKEASAENVGNFMIKKLGMGLVYQSLNKPLDQIPLKELAGKVILTFEHYVRADGLIDSCTINAHGNAFVNFKRAYAATNALEKLAVSEKAFFAGIRKTAYNDLIRLDWQLTQSADEAALVCNDFQSEKISPLVNGAMLLANMVLKHKSIRDLSLMGNKSLLQKTNEWIKDGTIHADNKPNILYVDMAGGWITDYCVGLNKSELYK